MASLSMGIGVEGVHHVDMGELGAGANFALEAAHRVGTGETFLADDLESDIAAHLLVPGLEDRAHPSFADAFEKDVPSQDQLATLKEQVW